MQPTERQWDSPYLWERFLLACLFGTQRDAWGLYVVTRKWLPKVDMVDMEGTVLWYEILY